MSSFSHQVYTRPWANCADNVALFSIDYRLSPAARFPKAVDDVWQAYAWIMLNARSYLGIDYKKVILVGDSAGGNLIIALTTMAIARKFRVPDAIMPCYPSTTATTSVFWPSQLNALDDPILSATFLNLAAAAYCPLEPELRFLGTINKYMSPALVAPVDILSNFPDTRLIVAGVDPLKDDDLVFFSRLLDAKPAKKPRIYEMEMMPHGFLNYNMPYGKGMKEAI